MLPGATAFVPALVLSGLDSGRFTFEGFLPRSGRERKERLKAVSKRGETSLIYESPHRLHATLQELAALCSPERRASVTRELSKKFEETVRGTLLTLAEHFAAGVKGEIVIALQGAPAQARATPDEGFAEQAAAHAAEGRSVREIRELLQRAGLRKNDAYELALHATGNDADHGTDQEGRPDHEDRTEQGATFTD